MIGLPDSVAYMLALVLESRQAALPDVGFALQQIEPSRAALCAQRPDRRTAVVPGLRRAHESLVEAVESGDEKRATPASREFTRRSCGSAATRRCSWWPVRWRPCGRRRSGSGPLLRDHLRIAQKYPMTGVSEDQRVQATLLRPLVQPADHV